MTNQTPPQNMNENANLTRITDQRGELVLELGTHETFIMVPGQLPITQTINEDFVLSCGTVFNIDMMFTMNPPILIGTCDQCRYPTNKKDTPTHGIVTISRAKLCVCGTLCCPKHRKLGSDNKWRCIKCHKKHKLISFFRKLFFTEEII